MEKLPSAIEELELLLKNRSISKHEKKRIKRKICKKKYALKNPEKFKNQKNKSHKKYIIKYFKNPKNRKKFALKAKEWKIKNKHRIRDYKRKRRGLQRCHYTPSLTANQIVSWELNCRSKDAICAYCLKPIHGKDAHIDHIIPLNRFGKHEIWNLCISCPTCNLKKSDKIPFVFIKTIENDMFYNKFKPIPSFTNFLQLFLKDQDEFFRLYFGDRGNIMCTSASEHPAGE